MFILYANKNRLTVREKEPVTSGSVDVYTARFEFSPDWKGLTRKAVFKVGKTSRAVLLDESGRCTIPWEVLTCDGHPLMVGVFGTSGETVLPTTWADLGTVLEGAKLGEDAHPPTPEVWEQELAGKGDGLEYDGLDLSLTSGGRRLSTIQVAGAGGGSDHRVLSHRDAEEQHPISSITGLTDELGRIPEPVEPMTNEELEVILR